VHVEIKEKEKKRKRKRKRKRRDYVFRRQFDEKSSIIPGCPGYQSLCIYMIKSTHMGLGSLKWFSRLCM